MIDTEHVVQRFLKYVSFDTQSDEDNDAVCPSTPGQLVFAKALAEELKAIGLSDVTLDEHGYIMATLPANGAEGPVVGFISHVDTSPDASGRDIKPVRVTDYDGKDVVLNEAQGLVFSTKAFPEVLKSKGQDKGDQGVFHIPAVHQEADLFAGEHTCHCPEQDLRRIELAAVAVGAHQPGEQGDRRMLLSPGHRQGQTHPALPPGILGTIGLVAVLVIDPAPRRLPGGPVDEGVVNDQKPDQLGKEVHHHPGHLDPKGDPGPLALLEPFIISAPTPQGFDRQPSPGDKSGLGEHGPDQQLDKGWNGTYR